MLSLIRASGKTLARGRRSPGGTRLRTLGRAAQGNVGRRFDAGIFEDYFLTFTEFALADPLYGPGLRTALEELLQVDSETRSPR